MQVKRLARVDLNLLVAFDALMTERNVTRAAAQLGLTQSAMSHVLRRLRELFKDPLFSRTPRGMLPTTRAQRLAAPVRQILESIDSAVHDVPLFDASTHERFFTLVAADYTQLVLLPSLIAHLAEHAPHIDVSVVAGARDYGGMLEDGRVDIVIGVFDKDLPSAYRQQLFHEKFVCVVRRDHPAITRELTMDQYVSFPHILIAPRGVRAAGIVDDELEKLGKKRRVAVTVPNFLVAMHLAAQSNMILTVGERLARANAETLKLQIVSPPIDLAGFTISQYWHERQHHDPANAWLRGVLSGLARDI